MTMAKIHHFDSFSIVNGDVNIRVDLDPLSDRFNRAQYQLDSMIMTSMEPFMPKQDSTLIDETKAASAAMAGTGRVCAGVPPYGRFLYEGKGMVDEKTGSPWARQSAKKVLVSRYGGKTNAKVNLSFSASKNPKAQPHWFDAAKEADGSDWVRMTKKIAGGG